MNNKVPVAIPVTALWLRQRDGKAQVLFEWQNCWYVAIEETEGAPYSHIIEVGGLADCKPEERLLPETLEQHIDASIDFAREVKHHREKP